MFKIIADKNRIFLELNAKFASNLDLALGSNEALAEEAEYRGRILHSIGTLLREQPEISPSQSEILCIFDEVFADIVIATYLAGAALDRPAQMSLRRALELGLATVYLWDLPHLFWGWKMHDRDLNFTEIVEHLSSNSYLSFVKSDNPLFTGETLLDTVNAKSIYRALSNTVHGKFSSFESLTPERFQYSKSDWTTHLQSTIQIESIIICLCRHRFECVESHLRATQPNLKG